MKSIMDTKPALGDGEVTPIRQGKAFGIQFKCVLFINRSKADVWKASQSWYDAFVDDPLVNYTRAVCFSTFLFPTNVHVPLIKVQHSLSREYERIDLRVLRSLIEDLISTPVKRGRKNPVNGLAGLLSTWILLFQSRLGTPEQKKV
jgi:hypothetical protein